MAIILCFIEPWVYNPSMQTPNPNRQLKHFIAKPQAIQIIYAPGFQNVALNEIRAVLNDLWFPPKFVPEVTPFPNHLMIRQIHLSTVYELLMRLQCIVDIRLVLRETKAVSKSSLEKKIHEIDWSLFLAKNILLKIKVNSVASQLFHETALKDMLADALHPYVMQIMSGDNDEATTTLFLTINKNKLTLSLSLAGRALYKRGYKKLTAAAPLREDIAACCIVQTQHFLAKSHYVFNPQTVLIPFSGTGTFAFEYLLNQMKKAPVLLGRNYALEQMPFFKRATFEYLKRKAGMLSGLPSPSNIICIDISETTLDVFGKNRTSFETLLNKNANLPEPTFILYQGDFLEMESELYLKNSSGDLFIPMNPPYGLRLNKAADTILFYKKIAKKLNDILKQYARRTLYGFILCPTQETWSGFYNELLFPIKETYHFTQGGLDIRVCQFLRKGKE